MNKHQEIIPFLQHAALQLRIDSIRSTAQSGSGHPTTCMSAADIVAAIFFYKLRYDLEHHENPNNDRFILSKGHAVPVVYAAWKQLGVITDAEMMSLREVTSRFEGHPTPLFHYNEAATGSLGQGLGIGLGMALSAKHDKRDFRTYVLLGDGEIAEGSVWEAAELAPKYNMGNLLAILDCNRLGQSGYALHEHDIARYEAKFKAFGWNTIVIDGHDMEQVVKALDEAETVSDKPTMIVAKTFKGFGLDDIADKSGYHGKPFKISEVPALTAQLNERFSSAANYAAKGIYKPGMPKSEQLSSVKSIKLNLETDPHTSEFNEDKKISARKAYGYGLAALGRISKDVFAVDADVKNSTYTDFFEKEFSDRFVQCYIAEQNMVSVATGLQARGKIPFASTFGAFFCRAFDQIRMAAIGRNALRLCGSHCGVSIGQDGPSQMALEDIAMFRAVPNSVVLYPSDGVSAYKLTECAANYNDGISYIRTTRADVPVLYEKGEDFKIGGCKVLRKESNAKACIIAAGITVHEALKAYDILKEQGIAVNVIDLYSVKPFDIATLLEIAPMSSNNIVTVEDHYEQGGIGEAITGEVVNHNMKVYRLAVPTISRSGQPEELMAIAQIDAKAIVKTVKLI